MATAGTISAELREWKRTTRYEPNEEEVEVLQRCRGRESNLQTLGSLGGLGLGMLLFASGSPVCRALSLERMSGAARGAGIFLPMIVGSGVGNSKAQSDCLKMMLPLQTPLGHQARLLLRKHDSQSSLARQYPVEQGIDSADEATLEYVGGTRVSPSVGSSNGSHDHYRSGTTTSYDSISRDGSVSAPPASWGRRGRESSRDWQPKPEPEPRETQEGQEDRASSSSSSSSSTAALRKAQFQRALRRRQLAGNGDGGFGEGGDNDYTGEEAREEAADRRDSRLHPHATFKEGDDAEQRRDGVSAEALRRRRVKEALERKRAGRAEQGAWGDEQAPEGRALTSSRNPYGDS